MANANRYVGKDFKAYWNTTTNEISGDVTAFERGATTDSAEKTAGSETVKTYIPTQTDESFSMTTYHDSDSYAGSALYNRLEGTLLYAPKGTADGNPAYQIPVFVSSMTDPIAYNETVRREFEFQANGQWVANYEELGSTWQSGTISP